MARMEPNGFERDGVVLGNLNGPGTSSSASVGSDQASPPRQKFQGKDTLSYANILRSRNKFADALVLYDNALEKDSGNVDALIGKGICLQMQNMPRQAFDCFSDAARLDPLNACALTHIGVLYKEEGRLSEAAQVYLLSYAVLFLIYFH